jgi:hypothetical protein
MAQLLIGVDLEEQAQALMELQVRVAAVLVFLEAVALMVALVEEVLTQQVEVLVHQAVLVVLVVRLQDLLVVLELEVQLLMQEAVLAC